MGKSVCFIKKGFGLKPFPFFIFNFYKISKYQAVLKTIQVFSYLNNLSKEEIVDIIENPTVNVDFLIKVYVDNKKLKYCNDCLNKN